MIPLFQSLFPGIFGYLNFLLPMKRRQILEILINGLLRLEYRGYDSAGVAFDSDELFNIGERKTLKTK